MASAGGKSVIPIGHLNNVHPTGAGNEFVVYAKDRLIRLRAPSATEAKGWVAEIMSMQLKAGKTVLGAEAPAAGGGSRAVALKCPALHATIDGAADGGGGAQSHSRMPDALCAVAAGLGESSEAVARLRERAERAEV